MALRAKLVITFRMLVDLGRKTDKQVVVEDEREAILLFGAGENNHRAVPLSLVARLEEIDVTTIETSDGKPVVQYRGSINAAGHFGMTVIN